jgi:hypothetical protein
MEYAHAHIDIKELPGVRPKPQAERIAATGAKSSNVPGSSIRPSRDLQPRILTTLATEAINDIETAFRGAHPLTVSRPEENRGARILKPTEKRVSIIGGNRRPSVISNRHHLESN